MGALDGSQPLSQPRSEWISAAKGSRGLAITERDPRAVRGHYGAHLSCEVGVWGFWDGPNSQDLRGLSLQCGFVREMPRISQCRQRCCKQLRAAKILPPQMHPKAGAWACL